MLGLAVAFSVSPAMATTADNPNSLKGVTFSFKNSAEADIKLSNSNNESTIIYNTPWAPAPTVIASVSRSLDSGITQPLTVCSINDVSEQLSCDITITPQSGVAKGKGFRFSTVYNGSSSA